MDQRIFRKFRGTVIAALGFATLFFMAPRQVHAQVLGPEYSKLADLIAKASIASLEQEGQEIKGVLSAVGGELGKAGGGTDDAIQYDKDGNTVQALSSMSGVVGNLTAANHMKISSPNYPIYVSAALVTAESIRDILIERITAPGYCGDGIVDPDSEQCDYKSPTPDCPGNTTCQKDCTCL
jgi:hypothetical protein